MGIHEVGTHFFFGRYYIILVCVRTRVLNAPFGMQRPTRSGGPRLWADRSGAKTQVQILSHSFHFWLVLDIYMRERYGDVQHLAICGKLLKFILKNQRFY